MVGKSSKSHERSPKQEKQLASRFKGTTTRGSGCGNEKGDVRIRGIARIEAKTTKNQSFSVTRGLISKLESATIGHGELPAFVIEFNDGNGNAVSEVAVIPTWALELLIARQQPEKNES